MKTNELTTRQQVLLSYLTMRAEINPNAWVSQFDICDRYSIKNFEDGYSYKNDISSHDKCSAIWQDINALNNNPTVEKIIVIKNNTYKLATKEEAEAYIDTKMNKALINLNRYWTLKRKVNQDGTMDLIDKEKFIRTFIDESDEKDEE